MKTILTTVGTSIAQSCKILGEYQRKATTWEDRADDLREQINLRLAGMDLTTDGGRSAASAEINSLNRLGVGPEDRVVLLATDTADGRACAEILKQTLTTIFSLPAGQVILHRIPGLQVRDAERLRTEGLVRFVDIVTSYIENPQYRHGGEIILNPTGGYKGIVPFLAAIGMIFKLKTVYVFEFANALITLPPLPVSFDLHLYERAAPALEYIHAEGAVPEARFFDRIRDYQPHEHDLFLGFVESDDTGMVTLSPLACVLLRISEQGIRNILLSPKAADALESADGLKKLALQRLLLRLSDPVWRSIHIHAVQGCDLEVYKPGNVAERALCITRDDHVHVCELMTDHDDYERKLGTCRRNQYPFKDFTLWEPDVPADDIETSYAATLEAELESCRNQVRILSASTGAKVGEAKKRSQETENMLRDKVRRLSNENEKLGKENKQLKDQVWDLQLKMSGLAEGPSPATGDKA
ncbi:MAG TPA: putative CRISPR-associated protein [Kiritimatiellia bacterium]|nr:putative CRISPR-associated protein [Kiritimatiellia bacterium]HMO98498.1 putative CRISPR-associated protein [Kiritimatiellia bacterium]HMP95806.1 putative CRISPR-associated protein [Kiritimatiellia bacterium]